MSAGQKRAPDLIRDGCEPPNGCQELNSGPLEEQAMLLTTEPSLQPSNGFFNLKTKNKKPELTIMRGCQGQGMKLRW